jgi:hypothetical protein
MKISKISWLFLIAGIVVIAALSLGMTHSSQSDQQRQLRDQLTAAQKNLASMDTGALVAKQTQLNDEIARAAAQVNATKGQLTSNWDGIDAISAVLGLAAQRNLDVPSINAAPVGAEQLGGAPCTTVSLNLQVAGTLPDVRDFILALTQKFPTAWVKSDQLDTQPPAEGDRKSVV